MHTVFPPDMHNRDPWKKTGESYWYVAIIYLHIFMPIPLIFLKQLTGKMVILCKLRLHGNVIYTYLSMCM